MKRIYNIKNNYGKYYAHEKEDTEGNAWWQYSATEEGKAAFYELMTDNHLSHKKPYFLFLNLVESINNEKNIQ